MLTGIENYLPHYREFQEKYFAPYNEPDMPETEDKKEKRIRLDIKQFTQFVEQQIQDGYYLGELENFTAGFVNRLNNMIDEMGSKKKADTYQAIQTKALKIQEVFHVKKHKTYYAELQEIMSILNEGENNV